MVAVGLITAIWAIMKHHYQATANPAIATNMKVIGKQLIGKGENGYALPFEVISILLLAAMIGSIVIAKKEKEQS